MKTKHAWVNSQIVLELEHKARLQHFSGSVENGGIWLMQSIFFTRCAGLFILLEHVQRKGLREICACPVTGKDDIGVE